MSQAGSAGSSGQEGPGEGAPGPGGAPTAAGQVPGPVAQGVRTLPASGKRFRWLWLGVLGVIFSSGVILRYAYIYRWHPLDSKRMLFSDSDMYYTYTKNFLDPNYQPNIIDTMHPPGARYFFGTLAGLEIWWRGGSPLDSVQAPPLGLIKAVHFLLAVLYVLVVADIAYELFGPRVSGVALCVSSLYFPFFDYFGFLLSEGPFMFFTGLSFALILRALKARGAAAALIGILAGIMLGCSGAIKTVSLPGAFFLLVVLGVLSWRYRRPWRRALAGALAGFLLILVPLSVRGTRLSEGRFCLIANDASRNILLGHYGDIGGITWKDRKRGMEITFASPSSAQKGYQGTTVLEFGVCDNAANLKEALGWIGEHPVESLLLSFEHLFDLALGTYPWPSIAVPETKLWAKGFHYLFLVLILLPALALVLTRARRIFALDPAYWGELWLLMPLLGLGLAAFVALGEPRYRIPFDAFILLLALRWYLGRQADEPDWAGQAGARQGAGVDEAGGAGTGGVGGAWMVAGPAGAVPSA